MAKKGTQAPKQKVSISLQKMKWNSNFLLGTFMAVASGSSIPARLTSSQARQGKPTNLPSYINNNNYNDNKVDETGVSTAHNSHDIKQS